MTEKADQTLDERIQQWERERKGLIGDLQAEREKRHNLEERLTMIESSIKSAEPPPEDVNEDDRINRFAKDPDGYISSIVESRVKTHVDRIAKLEIDRQYERAYRWLAKVEKKDEEEIFGSDLEKDIVRIVKEHGMSAMSPLDGTRAAYKIYLQEKREKDKKETERDGAISGNTTEPVRTPPPPGRRKFTRQEIVNMPDLEYEKNRDAILEAQASGWITEK